MGAEGRFWHIAADLQGEPSTRILGANQTRLWHSR